MFAEEYLGSVMLFEWKQKKMLSGSRKFRHQERNIQSLTGIFTVWLMPSWWSEWISLVCFFCLKYQCFCYKETAIIVICGWKNTACCEWAEPPSIELILEVTAESSGKIRKIDFDFLTWRCLFWSSLHWYVLGIPRSDCRCAVLILIIFFNILWL